MISPYVMMIMALVCQMKVNKYSEHVVSRGEIPKALHLIIDGEAATMFEETIIKDADGSEHKLGKGIFGDEPMHPVSFMRRVSPLK